MTVGLHRYYGAHHLRFITWSCYRRHPLLLSARSRDRLQDILEQVRRKYGFVVLGYVVMPERVHLLMSEPEVGTPSDVTQALKHLTARALPPGLSGRTQAAGVVRRGAADTVLASSLLWLQRVDAKKRVQKLNYDASESCEAGIGGGAWGLAREQFPVFFSGRSWKGCDGMEWNARIMSLGHPRVCCVNGTCRL
jgi:REP element-mobilizing transposase RayT